MPSNTVKCAIGSFNWEKLFGNKIVHSQVCIFNETILNSYHTFIPKKIITCNDKDPPCFNNEIRHLLNKKSRCLDSTLIKKNNILTTKDCSPLALPW